MANNFKSFITSAVGTNETVVYTAPSGGTATVIGFSIANITASDITVTARLQKPGPVYGHIVKDAVIPKGEALPLAGGDQKIVVQSNETLRVTSSVLSGCDVIVSVLEMV